MVIRRGLQVENLFRRETPLEGPLRQRSRRSQKMVYLPQATQLPASSSLVVGDVRMSCWLALLMFNDNSKDVVVVRYYSRKLWSSSLRDTDLNVVRRFAEYYLFSPRDLPDLIHPRGVPHSLLPTGMATF
jgi:hypothetical protein